MFVYLILVFFPIAVCSCALKTKTCTWSALSARRVVRPSRTRATTTSTPSCTATFTLSWLRAKTRPRPTSSRSLCLRKYTFQFLIHHTIFLSLILSAENQMYPYRPLFSVVVAFRATHILLRCHL